MDIVLTDKKAAPADQQLQDVLKKSYPHFVKLREMSGHHTQEWKYYNQKSGWVFKVNNKKRAMFYLTPLAAKFHFGMAVNDAERERILSGDAPQQIKDELASAKKYMEGYPVQLQIKSKSDLNRVIQTLKRIGRL